MQKYPLQMDSICGSIVRSKIKISVQELELLVLNPDETIAQGPKYLLVKRLTGRKDNSVAAVIIEKKEQDLWVIITVMVNFQKK